jgi:hypothetical protein
MRRITLRSLIKESTEDYSIYCDMDGVLVNFDKGYYDLTGKMPGKSGQNNGDPALFWAPVKNAGIKFWQDLEWMPDGIQLWKYIKIYNPILLSSPSADESSKTGKNAWVKYNLPGTNVLFKKAEEKAQFACPTCIMIDDREDVIRIWNEANGIGIHHTNTENTISQLKKLGL